MVPCRPPLPSSRPRRPPRHRSRQPLASGVPLLDPAAYSKLQALVRIMRDSGALLTTGTDLTNPWIIPGESLHQEFELLVAAGLSPSQVSGENAARALRSRDVGLIEPGRVADLVLLTTNPLNNIANTRSIQWL
ncbi:MULTISPECIES: amidohydrolase family protein [unclassified Bradyrhizobium]